jgi:antitoxin ParD1/3/4
MNVNLGPVFDQFIADLLKGGQYQSQSEVVREGLRMLKEREELKRLRIDELRREISRGGAQADRGELLDGDEAFRRIRTKSVRTKSAGRKTSAR